MSGIRKPAVAGTFYPRSKEQLSNLVEELMEGNQRGEFPKALIVPHAGYKYSGITAGKAYSLIRGYPGIPLVIGPSHYFRFPGLMQGGFDEWETPLGKIKQARIAGIQIATRPFIPEHSIEVQLPFLQKAGIREFIPVLTSSTKPDEYKKLLDYKGMLIVSSDFSHYHPLNEALVRDRLSHATIMSLSGGFIDACGEAGIRMLLELAKERGWKPELVHESTSYESTHDKSSVVGYRSYAFW